MISVTAALLIAAASCAIPPGEIELQAALPYQAFDSRDGPFGWRSLNAAGCTDAALALLADYAAANDTRLTDEQSLELAFHAGQVLAFAGRETEAIPYFEQATSGEAPPGWQAYVAATLAFLRQDATALEAARNAYAQIAPDSVRLAIIDGLIACHDEAYLRAVHCGM